MSDKPPVYQQPVYAEWDGIPCSRELWDCHRQLKEGLMYQRDDSYRVKVRQQRFDERVLHFKRMYGR